VFFIDHISLAFILDSQASIMDAPSKEHILDLKLARINHANNLAKAGAYESTNWLAYSFHHL